MRLSTDERETKAEFEFPADSVWRAVPLAYAAMSIPTEGMDAGHRLFVGNVTARSRFNNQALSRLVNCGSSLTGLNADTYNILLRVQAQVDSVTPTESTLRTRLEASGTGFGGNVVNCTSTGELERQLSNQVKLLVLKQ